ncbi:hypothetical protein M8J75_006553 [Diaphorina citri]|nr:hypothetical protein M8J75_006553 [Diaphorina citri]
MGSDCVCIAQDVVVVVVMVVEKEESFSTEEDRKVLQLTCIMDVFRPTTYSRRVQTFLAPKFGSSLATSFLCLLLLLPCCLLQSVQQCPPHNEISPCQCSVKKNGLDILCEFTDNQKIQHTMTTLKSKSGLIIFYLKLRHNNLPKLTGFIFFGLDIRHLTIHNSSLAVVEESSLSSIGKALTQLDLSQNSLAVVPSPALKSLNHLLILNLNHNKISALHSNAFQGLDTLEILTIFENKLSLIEPDSFKGLEKKLKRLNLGGNELTRVPQTSLSKLENLRKLELLHNRIALIEEGDFEGLHNLDSLVLAHNQLRTIPPRVFAHLPLLNSLELDGNHIHTVDPAAFSGLEENLQYLRLGDNNLHEVPSDALRPLDRLRHLDLRANNITSLSDDTFSHFGDSITFLNLQKNGLKKLPPLVFENLNSLEKLNLQNNKLRAISEDIMEPILDTLRDLDLVDNPLVCTCDLMWYKEWSTSLGEKEDEQMSRKRTVCTLGSSNVHQREYVVDEASFEHQFKCKLLLEADQYARSHRSRDPNASARLTLNHSVLLATALALTEIKLSDLPKQLVCEGEKGGRRSPNSAPSASLSGSFIALLVAAADLVCIVF